MSSDDQRTQQAILQQKGQNSSKEKAQLLGSNDAALKANAAQAQNPLNAVGAASTAYKNSAADAAQGITSYGTQQADSLASMDAPGLANQNNVKNIHNYANDLGLINRRLQGQNYLDTLHLQGIRRDPWLDAFSGLAGGAANAFGKGMFSGGEPTSKPYSGYMDNATPDYGYGDIGKLGGVNGTYGYSPFLDQSSVINLGPGYFGRK